MSMKPETRSLLEKMKRAIETSDEQHKDVLTRWLSLANLRIHKKDLKTQKDWPDSFGTVGASMALRRNYEEKFGCFSPNENPVTR